MRLATYTFHMEAFLPMEDLVPPMVLARRSILSLAFSQVRSATRDVDAPVQARPRPLAPGAPAGACTSDALSAAPWRPASGESVRASPSRYSGRWDAGARSEGPAERSHLRRVC